jgi:predicted Zn-dependent peptidase
MSKVKYTQGTLTNGVKYIYIPNNNIFTFSLVVAFKVGGRDETDVDFGYSHLLEHMLFKGTTRRPNVNDISEELENLGGSHNASTSQHITNYYIKAPKENFEKCMDLIFDMVFNSIVRKEDLEMEKKVVVEELSKMKDNPSAACIENGIKDVFLDHPLGQSVIGTKESIMAFDRDKVYEYYKRFYNPGNMTISIAGNVGKITKKKLEKMLTKFTSTSYANITSSYVNPIKTHKLSIQTAPRLNIETRPNSQQCAIMIGFPCTNLYDIKSICTMQVLEAILGGGLSSRLFVAVRVKAGLAYTVDADSMFFEDAGVFLIVTAVEKDSLLTSKTNNSDGGLPIILNVLEDVLQNGVTKDEVTRAKLNIINKLSMAYENTHSIALYYNEQLMMKPGNIYTIQDFISCIKKVSMSHVNKIARKYMSFEKMTIGVVGNYTQQQIMEHLGSRFINE